MEIVRGTAWRRMNDALRTRRIVKAWGIRCKQRKERTEGHCGGEYDACDDKTDNGVKVHLVLPLCKPNDETGRDDADVA